MPQKVYVRRKPAGFGVEADLKAVSQPETTVTAIPLPEDKVRLCRQHGAGVAHG
jgi:hypothetical protein